MKKQLLVFSFCLIMLSLKAQTFQVFKGDTINHRDAEGLQQGVWRKYYKNDQLASEMFFKHGRHVDTFKTWSEEGKIQSQVTFRGATEIGDAVMYYADGSPKAKGKYINKMKDSTWTYFDGQGKLEATEYYVKGKQEGLWKTFYPDGKVADETIYKNGVKNGPHREFFPDGTQKLTSTNKNGEYEGMVTIMNPGGKIWMQGKYVAGLRDGKWIVNKEDGSLDREDIYKKGKLTNPVFEKEERIEEKDIQTPEK